MDPKPTKEQLSSTNKEKENCRVRMDKETISKNKLGISKWSISTLYLAPGNIS